MGNGCPEKPVPEGMRDFDYLCDPALCREHVCCGHFDIAISAEEKERILALLPRLKRFCPWLADEPDIFRETSCFLFLCKRQGLCVLNFPVNGRNAEDGYYCALHALALQDGENPYAVKPRGCALWPLLEDGAGNLRVDDETTRFPCLRRREDCSAEPAPELQKLWESLPSRQPR